MKILLLQIRRKTIFFNFLLFILIKLYTMKLVSRTNKVDKECFKIQSKLHETACKNIFVLDYTFNANGSL